jgi:hypothetical protein
VLGLVITACGSDDGTDTTEAGDTGTTAEGGDTGTTAETVATAMRSTSSSG